MWDVDLPSPCSNEDYESIMSGVCKTAVQAGIEYIAFGDLFLRDVRDYREKQLKNSGLTPLFPIWTTPTRDLASTMIEAGVKAKLSCVDGKSLSPSFVGRDFDQKLLADLPREVDPCGENGEFHTFVYDSPVFSRPIAARTGEVVERDGFVFADVLA